MQDVTDRWSNSLSESVHPKEPQRSHVMSCGAGVAARNLNAISLDLQEKKRKKKSLQGESNHGCL